MTGRIFPAKADALGEVIAFVEETLEAYSCPFKTTAQICVAVEEMFVNVANYAYGDKEGEVGLDISFNEDECSLTFRISDKGFPFNPLEKEDPDITLSAEDRQIGGLGVYLVKKTMDSVSYAYENGENLFTMIKKI